MKTHVTYTWKPSRGRWHINSSMAYMDMFIKIFIPWEQFSLNYLDAYLVSQICVPIYICFCLKINLNPLGLLIFVNNFCSRSVEKLQFYKVWQLLGKGGGRNLGYSSQRLNLSSRPEQCQTFCPSRIPLCLRIP